MEQRLINAFDSLTIEELNTICPVHISSELDQKVLERIRNRVIERLGAGSEKTVEIRREMQHDTPIERKARLLRTLLIAAIIALLAAASVLAISLGGGRFLESLFGRENYDMIEQYVMSDLAQESEGNLRLTLESALTDGHYYYVVFSVGSLDGSSLGDRFPDIEFTFTLESPSRIQPGFQLEKLDMGESTDSLAYYVALIRSSQSEIQSMRMELRRLFSLDGSQAEIPAAMAVEANFIPCPLAVGGDSEGAFRSIELSPFGLWIDVYDHWEEDDALSAGIPIYDIFLLYEDGSQIGVKAEQFADPEYLERIGWGGMQLPNGTHQSYISIRFNSFVDVSKVKAVVIHGQEYPLRMGGS